MPSGEAQMNLIQDTYLQAGLDPLLTPYVEAHGTGTKAGDPIEVDAIAAALSSSRDPSKPLLIGSVKANVGHLESASGLAGLIKAVLCLEKGMVPPSVNFETVNPALRLEEKSMRVRHLQSCLAARRLIKSRLQQSLNHGRKVLCAGPLSIALAMVVPMHMLYWTHTMVVRPLTTSSTVPAMTTHRLLKNEEGSFCFRTVPKPASRKLRKT